MKEIILDTNFCLLPFRSGIDIFREIERICDFNYELSVPEEVVAELVRLSKSNSKTGRYAKAAIALLQQKGIKFTKSKKVINTSILQSTEKDGDEAIISYAKENKEAIIATDDKLLMKRLPGFDFISTRQKQYLTLRKN